MRTLSQRLARRKKRVSANISGSSSVPRIAIHRSNRYMYAQAIDDKSRKTLVGASSKQIETSEKKTKTESSKEMGKVFASELIKKGVKQAIIDRSRFHYLGRVLQFVEGLREGGIQV